MTRPKLVDFFCGAGGLSMGYHRAGFDVTGVDQKPHPDYPFQLIVADAMELAADLDFLNQFVVAHGSPPCPRFSTITPEHTRGDHPDLLTPFRQRMKAWGGLYVIENVPAAPMPAAILLCGKAMGYPHIQRHRLFESNAWLMSPGCACDGRAVYGVYGDHWDREGGWLRPDGTSRGRKATSLAHAQQILGVDWMTDWDDLADCVPPNYAEYVGAQILDQLEAAA